MKHDYDWWILALVALVMCGTLIYSTGGWNNDAETGTVPIPTATPEIRGEVGKAAKAFRCAEDEGYYIYLAENGLPIVTCLHPDLIMD